MEYQKRFLITLKNTLLYRVLINNFFLLAIGLVILLFSLNFYYCFVLYFIYCFYLYRKNLLIFKTLIVISIFVILIFLVRKVFVYDKGYTNFTGTIISITKKDEYNKLIVKKGLEKIIVYDSNFLDVRIGDYIEVSGLNREICTNRIEEMFDYQKYYFCQNIVSIIKSKDIELIERKFNIYFLRKYIYQYIVSNFDNVSQSYILGMVLGDSTKLDEVSINSIKINGISHLFAISGLHISLLVSILSQIFDKLKIQEKKKENIICVILVLYLVITNLAVSILRASLMYILSVINKRWKLGLSSLDIISVIFVLLVIINPNLMYYLSFILSFSASFFIILLSQTLKDYHLKSISELFVMTILLQVITLPIVININHCFNLLSILANVFFISLVTSIILPITFLVLLLPFLNKIYYYIIIAFSTLNELFSKYLSLEIDLPNFSKLEMIIYYLLLLGGLFLIKNNKGIKILKGMKIKVVYLFTFFVFFFCYYNKINLNQNGKIYFLDIYEGDCTIIDLPYNKGIVVIDTGTAECTEVIEFLKAKGIRKIDYLVLTHKHDDHCGNNEVINEEFVVNKIVISAYDNNVNVNNKYYQEKLLKVKKGDKFSINSYTFTVLGPYQKESDDNDNSVILYVKLGNYKYLFLGDASIKKEEELMSYHLDCDCVKVAHHGSLTSSSEKFYQSINPKYVFIETGRVTKFGFPNKKVIERLSSYKIYRTDLNYSIKVEFNEKRSIISSLK